MRVALYGGSFNPPHVAHVLASVYALSTAPIDRVLVVPVFQHPFSKELAPFEDRLAMCHAALGWIPGVEISAVERELGGESLTLRTVEHLVAAHPSWSLRLLIGADVLGDLHKWHRWDRIAALAPPIVLGRAGVTDPGAPLSVLPEVSSSAIRRAIAEGKRDDLARLLPRTVLDIIEDKGLYGHQKA